MTMLFLRNETLLMLLLLNFITFSLSTGKEIEKGNEDIENVAANAQYKGEKNERLSFEFL